MPASKQEWLVVIDMQNIFSDPTSDWAALRFEQIVPVVQGLLSLYGERVVFTRFVAPAEPSGAWIDYYDEWPFALQSPDSAAYAVVEALHDSAGQTVDCTTFGKWGAELSERTGGADLVLVGVATECCVLSTALAAADAGVKVTVVTDACAGATDEDHDRALAAMSRYAPLVQLISSADLRGTSATGQSTVRVSDSGSARSTVSLPE